MASDKKHPNTLGKDPATGLLIIDVQEKFRPAIDGFDQIVENIVRLILGFQMFRMPILVTEQYPKGLGSTVDLIRAQFELLEISEKLECACTLNSSFMAKLNALQLKTVVVCGVESHVCVNQTVHGLLQAGCKVHVVADAIGSRNALDHEFALKKMIAGGAIPATMEIVLFELAERAGTEPFKLVQKMVKSHIRRARPLDPQSLDSTVPPVRIKDASPMVAAVAPAPRPLPELPPESAALEGPSGSFDIAAPTLDSGVDIDSGDLINGGSALDDDGTRPIDTGDLSGLEGFTEEPEVTV